MQAARFHGVGRPLALPLARVNDAMDILHEKQGDPVRIVVEP